MPPASPSRAHRNGALWGECRVGCKWEVGRYGTRPIGWSSTVSSVGPCRRRAEICGVPDTWGLFGGHPVESEIASDPKPELWKPGLGVAEQKREYPWSVV